MTNSGHAAQLLLLLALVNMSGEAHAAGTQAPLVCETSDLAFAPFLMGERRSVSRTFRLRNLLDRDIKIARVEPWAHTTVTGPARDLLRPGEATSLTLSVDLTSICWRYQGETAVYTDLKPDRPVILKMAATVIPRTEILPATVAIGSCEPRTSRSVWPRVVRRRRKSDPVAKALCMATSSPRLAVTITPPRPARSSFRGVVREDVGVNIRVSSGVRPGPRRESLQVRDVTGGLLAKASVTWHVSQRIVAYPPRVFFGLVQPGESPQRAIRIYARAPEPIEITGIEFDRGVLDVAVTPGRDRKAWTLNVSLLPTAPKLGVYRGQIRVRVGAKREKEVALPVFALREAGDVP